MDNAGDNVAPMAVAEIDVEKSTLPFTAVKDVLFDDVAVSNRLRAALIEIDAICAPVCVYEKKMARADRLTGQNRLLVSCRTGRNKMAFAKIFTKKEMLKVQEEKEENKGEEEEDKEKVKVKKEGDEEEEKKTMATTKLGLDVRAYDGYGRRYHVTCQCLSSNGTYRIKGVGWTLFLANNDLHEEIVGDVRFELWVFRSRKLALGLTDQPDGALGLVFLRHRQGGGAEQAPEEDPLEEHGAAADDVDEPAEVVDVQGEAAADFTPNELAAAAGLLLLKQSGNSITFFTSSAMAA